MQLSWTAWVLRSVTALLLATGLACCTLGLFRIEPLKRPTTGLRGEMRKRILRDNFGWRALEPLLLRVGGWLRALELSSGPYCRPRLGRYFAWQEHQLTLAGRSGGLDAYELSALALLGAVLLSALVGVMTLVTSKGGVWLVPAGILGAALPNLRLQGLTAERFKLATKNLPASIDLAALCMSAGADFSQALRYIVEGGDDLIAEELARVLHALEVGHTRKAALLELSKRLPVEPVQDMVRSLVQAEEKGSPLTEALQNQARSSRMRRSVAAEEAAARAGVLMILPLMLLLGCIVLLLLGPFMVTGGGL